MKKPLLNKKLLIKKIPGKGGWSYVEVDGINPNTKTKFGMVRVKGSIDTYEIKQYNLMPMGNGNLFLPVKAQIRKQLKKEAGDYVQVKLFLDESVLQVPQELLDCLNEYPAAIKYFNKISQSEKKYYVDWVYSAKHEETKANRIVKMIDKLISNKKLHEK